MGKYSCVWAGGATGTDKTMVNITGGATIRVKMSDIIIGSDAAVADQYVRFAVARTTTAGTAGSTPTPQALDPLTVAATATAGIAAFSGEPSYAATFLMNIGLNQRATFRWVAAPGYELVAAASASAGIGLKSSASGGTPTATGTVMWEE